MNVREVQTLVIRAPCGPAVAHQILRIPEGLGRAAACLLNQVNPSFGPEPAVWPSCSIGFSFAGLEAIGVPEGYLRPFRRLAPAFAQGAVRRSGRLGDSGDSAAARWLPAFRQDDAHVVLSWHGAREAVVCDQAERFTQIWNTGLTVDKLHPHKSSVPLVGARLAGPGKQEGHWVHFGFRDGLSEVCIDNSHPRPSAPDLRRHAEGALLLGRINDSGYNPFSLTQAPEKVRTFFYDSSFGILRPMRQELAAFEQQVGWWADELTKKLGRSASRDFIKAKLCGRWPDGQAVRPGEMAAPPKSLQSLVLNLSGDDAGTGCPFGSHVRRMRASPDSDASRFKRPLQRRGVPYGTADWLGEADDNEARGLLGHFFCASIEDQFEHLLGQWGARPPLGFPPDNNALDPLIGPHEEASAALAVPLKDEATQYLSGFRTWTTTQGTLYAWHPSKSGLRALLEDDFMPEDEEGPWL